MSPRLDFQILRNYLIEDNFVDFHRYFRENTSDALLVETDDDGNSLLMHGLLYKLPLHHLRQLMTTESVSKANSRGKFPLIMAIEQYTQGLFKIVNSMLLMGADPNVVDPSGKPAVFYVFQHEDKWPAIRCFIESPSCSIWQRSTGSGISVLHLAAATKCVYLLRKLLSLPGIATVLNVRSTTTGSTPLHRAVRSGCTQMVRYLINAGADPSIPNTKLHTPLTLAMMKRSCSLEMLDFLWCNSSSTLTIRAPRASLASLNELPKPLTDKLSVVALLIWKCRGNRRDVTILKAILNRGCEVEKNQSPDVIPASTIAATLFVLGHSVAKTIMAELLKPCWGLNINLKAVCDIAVAAQSVELIELLYASMFEEQHACEFILHVSLQLHNLQEIYQLVNQLEISCVAHHNLIPMNSYLIVHNYLVSLMDDTNVNQIQELLASLLRMKGNN